jgi:replicative DNA helicase
MLLRPAAVDVARDALTPECFRMVGHRAIFEAMLAVAGRGAAVDLVTVLAELRTRKTLDEAGGASALASLVEGVPRASNVEHYCGLVREAAQLRGLQVVLLGVCQQASAEAGSSDELIAEAEKRLRELSAGRSLQTLCDGDALAGRLWERLRAADANGGSLTGLSTGFYDLDRLTTGLHPGELYILAGRPGMGKTSLSGAMAWYAATHDRVAFFASLEMTTDDVALRLACLEARVSFTRAREWRSLSEDDRRRILSAIGKVETSGLVIDDTPRSVADVRRGARVVQQRKGRLDLVVIDYLTLLRPSTPSRRGDNRVREIGEMTGECKAMAKELRVPVLLLAQLNRACETRQDKRPLLSDLRDSGEIEQDADLVAFVYLGHKYDDGPDNVGEVIVAKQRNGPVATVELRWTGEFMRYDNLETR